MIQAEVFHHIALERKYQHEKWGIDKEQSLAGYLLVMQRELNEAVDGWIKNRTGRDSALYEVLQVCAVGVACLEAYGVSGTTISTNDISMERSN